MTITTSKWDAPNLGSFVSDLRKLSEGLTSALDALKGAVDTANNFAKLTAKFVDDSIAAEALVVNAALDGLSKSLDIFGGLKAGARVSLLIIPPLFSGAAGARSLLTKKLGDKEDPLRPTDGDSGGGVLLLASSPTIDGVSSQFSRLNKMFSTSLESAKRKASPGFVAYRPSLKVKLNSSGNPQLSWTTPHEFDMLKRKLQLTDFTGTKGPSIVSVSEVQVYRTQTDSSSGVSVKKQIAVVPHNPSEKIYEDKSAPSGDVSYTIKLRCVLSNGENMLFSSQSVPFNVNKAAAVVQKAGGIEPRFIGANVEYLLPGLQEGVDLIKGQVAELKGNSFGLSSLITEFTQFTSASIDSLVSRVKTTMASLLQIMKIIEDVSLLKLEVHAYTGNPSQLTAVLSSSDYVTGVLLHGESSAVTPLMALLKLFGIGGKGVVNEITQKAREVAKAANNLSSFLPDSARVEDSNLDSSLIFDTSSGFNESVVRGKIPS